MLDKSKLLTPRLPEADVDVDGLGTVRVRGMTREEALSIRSVDGGTLVFERRMLVAGLLDPVLTEDEVEVWQRCSVPGEIEAVVNKISELSGLNSGAAKEAYKEFDEDPDAEFRVLPGDAAGDDGGSSEG